jgi:hypothetical protein
MSKGRREIKKGAYSIQHSVIKFVSDLQGSVVLLQFHQRFQPSAVFRNVITYASDTLLFMKNVILQFLSTFRY